MLARYLLAADHPGAANAFGIFWMRQYIDSAIPDDLMDAARIDGAHEFRIYWNIVVPVITPALAAPGDHDLHGELEQLLLAAADPEGRGEVSHCPWR